MVGPNALMYGPIAKWAQLQCRNLKNTHYLQEKNKLDTGCRDPPWVLRLTKPPRAHLDPSLGPSSIRTNQNVVTQGPIRRQENF